MFEMYLFVAPRKYISQTINYTMFLNWNLEGSVYVCVCAWGNTNQTDVLSLTEVSFKTEIL